MKELVAAVIVVVCVLIAVVHKHDHLLQMEQVRAEYNLKMEDKRRCDDIIRYEDGSKVCETVISGATDEL